MRNVLKRLLAGRTPEGEPQPPQREAKVLEETPPRVTDAEEEVRRWLADEEDRQLAEVRERIARAARVINGIYPREGST